MSGTRLAARGIASDPHALSQRSSGLVNHTMITSWHDLGFTEARRPACVHGLSEIHSPEQDHTISGSLTANPRLLSGAAAADEMHDDHNDPNHQKYVNETHRHVKCQKPQQPENEQYCADCGQHRSSWLQNLRKRTRMATFRLYKTPVIIPVNSV